MNRSNDPSLDYDAINSLKDATEEMFEEIIETFLEDTDNHLELLQKAVLKNDFTSLIEESHSIKGSSGNIGACKLSAICAGIEKESRKNMITNQADDVKQAVVEFETVKIEFIKILASS